MKRGMRTIGRRLLAWSLSVSAVSAAGAAPEPVKAGEWIKTWKLCGPIPLESVRVEALEHQPGFEKDYLKAAGGETGKTLRTDKPVRHEGVEYAWQTYESTDSIVDLGQALGKRPYSVSYAYAERTFDKPGFWLVSLGSDDGARLWVNGRLVWDGAAPRYARADENVIPVRLQAGVNRFLLKVENKAGNSYCCFRVLPYSTEALQEGPARLYDFLSREDGSLDFYARQQQPAIDGLVSDVRVRLTDPAGDPVTERVCPKNGSMRLVERPLPCARYTAQITVGLKTGETLRYEQPVFAGKVIDYPLFADGKSDYTIVLGRDASESERFAAEELQRWIREIGGAELPIDSLSVGTPGRRILVGYTPELSKLVKDQRPDSADESFTYRNVGGDILIYGGSRRGTMYGVYSFLERELGCRWYTPTATVTPKRGRWAFRSLYNREAPGIAVRNNYYLGAFDPLWAARNRNNGMMGGRNQPGGFEGYFGCHTFNILVPVDQYFAEHPEYFSLIDGKRTNENPQLCLTNPDVLRLCIEGIRKQMREHPEYRIYDVSQNDWGNPCQCEKCQAIVREEGSESGVMIWFVNQVADAVKEEFPDKYVGTFAYQYTRKPPKQIRPRENVVVRFCSIECCFVHDFYGCPQNRTFVEDMERWAALAPNVYVWDYVVTFSQYSAPFPNFYVLQPNIQAFRKNHAIGIMEQGAYQSPGAEFAELRTYLVSKLLWNPDCDVDAVIDDFMYGYYGRAGQYVRAYFDLMHAQIKPDVHMTIYPTPQDPIYTDAFLREASEIFDRAERVAENEEMLRRVELASLPVYFLRCMRNPLESKVDGSYQRVRRIAEREKMTVFAEWIMDVQGFYDFMDSQR